LSWIPAFLKRSLPKSAFIKGVSVLAGGTAISQLIAIAVLPLLTRLYSPEDFSMLAVYTSILALVTVISCLRFEIAIPIPKEIMQAKELLALSIISVLCVNAIVSILIFVFSEPLHAITQDRLRGYLWLIPIGGVLAGLYAAFQYWSTREKNFVLISKTRMTQSIGGAGTQLGLGYLGVTPLGLLLGQLINVGAGVFGLFKSFYLKNSSPCKDISVAGLKSTLREYENFPKYSTFEALSNSAGIQVPILLIAAYAAGPEVGFLMLAIRLLSAPMGLLGGAVGQVYLSEAPAHFQNGTLKEFTKKTVWTLAKIGAPPILLVAIAAPFLVPIIFGGDWARTGVLITWMAPWFFAQFITSPVSMSLHITGNQKAALALQLFGLAFRVGAVMWVALVYGEGVGEIYAVSGAIFYAVYLAVVLRLLRK